MGNIDKEVHLLLGQFQGLFFLPQLESSFRPALLISEKPNDEEDDHE